MLKRARRSAGWSQAELAARSGVAQPVISAYERGARQPSVRALQTLLAALGKRLAVVDESVDATRNRRRAARLRRRPRAGYCTAEPRATMDLDVNVFLAPAYVDVVAASLDGVVIMDAAARADPMFAWCRSVTR